ncbi:MAG: hypothetical protein J7L14_03400 [Candidatus Diapherotrites archaeon]|nr:hypothetical protein [Candidatus Diapherotrites archaeon]
MKFSLVASNRDEAGKNIAAQLINLYGFKENGRYRQNKKFLLEFANNEFELIFIDDETIYADYVDELSSDAIIFLSKHESKSEKPSLTVHSTGNWCKEAAFGGKAREISLASALINISLLRELAKQKEKAELSYEVVAEVTHHGPLIKSKPSCFIELGSSIKEWQDSKAAQTIATTVIEALSKKQERIRAAVGIGGLHYASEFSKLMLRANIGFAHICPKYALYCFDAEMLSKAIEMTAEKVNFIVVDEKGLATEKQRIMDLLGESKIKIEGVRKLLKKHQSE